MSSEHVHALGCGCGRAQARGWAAIEDALRAAHPGIEPAFYTGASAPDEMPLDAVACFALEDRFELVSLGLSELYDKTFANPATSGHGFELTLAVPRDAETPPPWAVQLIRNLAEYVSVTQRPLRALDHLDAGIALAPDSALTAVCFVADALGAIETPFGRLAFLRVLGLFAEELATGLDGDLAEVVGLLSERDPLGVLDPGRDSLLADEARARHLRARVAEIGSSQEGAAVARLGWREDGGLVVTVGQRGVPALRRALLHRVPFAREYRLQGQGRGVHFAPAPSSGWHEDGRQLTLLLAEADARGLGAALAQAPGRYAAGGSISLEVVVDLEVP